MKGDAHKHTKIPEQYHILQGTKAKYT